uniref:Uncharacterized protein n=1 Tax=Arundo donax TaxID=35708 RepID=A0A0A9BHH7_ARUDO
MCRTNKKKLPTSTYFFRIIFSL